MSDTLERVKKVTAQVLKVDQASVDDESRFVEDLGAESIQSVELVARFEEEFDIEMDEDEALSVRSVKDAAAYIDKLLEE
jgi:acyl carrier protein